MLPSRGKLLFDSLKSSSFLLNGRYTTLPQNVPNSAESSPATKEKQKKEPFMKNIFLGKFHEDFLSFSVCKGIDESSNLHHLHSIFKEHNKEQSSETSCYHKCLTSLAENGFYYIAVPQLQSKVNVSYSELIKFYEDLNLNPSLALLLEVQTSLVIPTLYNYGSNQQKDKYLKKLLSGEITGAYALCEENSGSDPADISTVASVEGNNILLNGEKFWVTNALKAQFYIVFANVLIENLVTNNKGNVNDLSVFLVERSEGLQIKEHNLHGLNHCDIGKIIFKDHYITKSSVFCEFSDGFKIASDMLTNHKFIILSSILSSLKNLTKIVTSHINKHKKTQDLKDCELIKRRIANIVSVTYSLESMLYFTCNLLDNYIIDTSLESALLQIYGYEKGIQAIMECLDLLGSRSYDKAYDFEELLRDIKGLRFITTNKDVIRSYSSLVGLDHAGNALKETIIKNRNPFNYPSYIFKKLIRDRRIARGSPKYTLNLYMNLHPSLKASANQLEHCVLCFQYTVETLLSRHGSEIVKRHVDLNMISDIALDIFTMSSVLCRASHSYCAGIQHCDQEVTIAKSICFELSAQVKRKIEDILDASSILNNSLSLGIGETVLFNQSYFFENPHKTCF